MAITKFPNHEKVVQIVKIVKKDAGESRAERRRLDAMGRGAALRQRKINYGYMMQKNAEAIQERVKRRIARVQTRKAERAKAMSAGKPVKYSIK